MLSDKDTNTMTISKDTFYGIIIVVLAGLLVLSVLTQGFGVIKSPAAPVQPTAPTQPTQPTAPAQPTQPTQPSAPSAPTSLQVAFGDYPQLGNSSAPVAWVEFSDFQCPFCERLYSDAELQVRTNYITPGKVKLYYRDYPLPFHPNADPAANAARCANEQGKFWAMHDKLMAAKDLSAANIQQLASDTGLDRKKFDDCVAEERYKEQIDKDLAAGQAAGVNGTPAFFINGRQRMTTGEKMPCADFDEVLQSELREIESSRRARASSPSDVSENPTLGSSDDPDKKAAGMNLVGLAFSGGGIRSATFNLGILQGLARRGLLRSIDYLSTVSGGGYIGSWFTAWIKRVGSIKRVEEELLCPAGSGAAYSILAGGGLSCQEQTKSGYPSP